MLLNRFFPTINRAARRQFVSSINYKYTPITKRFYTMEQHSAACCSIPPVVVKGYEPKGKYEDIGGLKTCQYYNCRGSPIGRISYLTAM